MRLGQKRKRIHAAETNSYSKLVGVLKSARTTDDDAGRRAASVVVVGHQSFVITLFLLQVDANGQVTFLRLTVSSSFSKELMSYVRVLVATTEHE